MLKKIEEISSFLLEKVESSPEIGIILGTGLGGLISEIQNKYTIDYKDIPSFPVSTVEGHSGRMIFGTLSGKNVMVMQGRFHFYEGYNMQEVTLPVRIMHVMGVQKLIVSNASGGVNPEFKIGDLMILSDHINLIPNPLIGPNLNTLGTRFPDMSDAYDSELIRTAEEIGQKNNIALQKGVYVAVTGPCLETPAEYKFIRTIGGDAVGMSTVPEIIVARHMKIPCFAISVITDLGVPGKIQKVTHEDVQNVAENAEPKLTLIVKKLIQEI